MSLRSSLRRRGVAGEKTVRYQDPEGNKKEINYCEFSNILLFIYLLSKVTDVLLIKLDQTGFNI